VLEIKARVSVRTISFEKAKEIDEKLLREIIFEAIMLDETKNLKKTGCLTKPKDMKT
jgi:hypothetical protein